ncbi:hypothetical protein LCL89_09350 [Halobacillus yeomjeoni]|uniref:hypothetical protein n=1 Tax=Halobacillus yeomjeoni TaxID=311194 RepID=UPI001CD3B2DB|nr:hypothetical protein [Halobacillus yeomjeoni]MCA0984249.1 hypothetical protein [Halobacillus yeomjeoni]
MAGHHSDERKPEVWKQEVFKEKLFHLMANGYISKETYEQVMDGERSYVEAKTSSEAKEQPAVEHEQEQVKTPEPAKPKKKKKVKTPEQIRERNITWSLILGVALLLITGLIVATSQWAQMGPGVKVVSIAFVSLFFFGLSYGTGRFLKIHQTSFAFLTLGSLLIPITILAIGYFELFGSYLSLFGEGKYLLGLIGTLLPLPLYVRHAIVHQSRMYVWISFLFLTLSVGFALGSTPLTTDGFYLMLMVYNAALIAAYVRYKDDRRIQLFTKELPLFAQLNLVLSTLLMLFFFESEVFYSFNLLLTASIYMAMVFVYKTKEYQFVFSVMMVYAIYQLVEHSPLEQVDWTIYALAGLLYLGFAYAFNNHAFIQKVFHYTSGVVSFCAFVFITYEAIALRGDEGAWLLFFAYVVITFNYFLLANVTPHLVFKYMTPIFYFISLGQLWSLVDLGPLYFFLYGGAVVLFVYAGLWSRNRWMSVVKTSSFYTSLIVLFGSIGFSVLVSAYGKTALMFFGISMLAYLTVKKSRRKFIQKIALWTNPAALVLASTFFYEPLRGWLPRYEETFAFPFHIGVTGVLLIAVFFGWRLMGKRKLSSTTFYVGQGTYLGAIVLLIDYPGVDVNVIRPLMLSVGIAMMYSLVQYAKYSVLWGFVSLVTLGFYLSLIDPFGFEAHESMVIYITFAPVLLILLAEVGSRKWGDMRPYFYWLAHIVQPFIIVLILLNQFVFDPVHPAFLMVPLLVYLYSSLSALRESEISAMLYAASSVLFLLILTVPEYYGWWGDALHAFLITSVLLSGIWVAIPHVWKKRLEWYWIPFSLIGLMFLTSQTGRVSNVELVLILGYTVLNLVFLHIRRWPWVRFVPLLLTISIWETVGFVWEPRSMIVALIAGIFVLMGAGYHFHTHLLDGKKNVDAYSWMALVYIAFLVTYTSMEESIWIHILPLVLAGGWLWITSRKWKAPLITGISFTAGMVGFYSAYVLVLVDYQSIIPDLIEAELQALPVLGLLVYLRVRTWKAYPFIMNQVQFGILLLVAAFLVVDAIQSHTIWDAWIIGGLSLVSMVAGMQLKIKSYFFVGMGVLIFNVLYQTKPYWGNAPWWVYLLIAGLLLISVASYNEWQKQQSSSGKPVERKLKRLWLALKRWN